MYLSLKQVVLLAVIVFAVTISVTYALLWIGNPDPSTIDSDGDGIMDDKDMFPDKPFEQNDSDNDGIGDNQDAFPLDPSASIDSDEDGYPDRWNPGKSQRDSTSQPPLTLDAFPYDPSEHQDNDSDGIGDNADVFPNDPTESRDDDGDGIGNNADQNPFVDLSFTLSLNQITLTKHVDILPWAQVYVKVFVNGEEIIKWDNNGSYYYIWKNRPKTLSKTVSYDIPELSENDFTEIEIQAFDYDLLRQDKLLDINKNNDLKSIKIRLYHESNSLIPESVSSGGDASISYIVALPEEQMSSEDVITKNFRWKYQNTFHTLTIDIPTHKYEWAVHSSVNRSPQTLGSEAMSDFATVNDSVIMSLANKLQSLAENNNYNATETVNFVISFVQQTIDYKGDNESKGQKEYWRYPIETIVDEQGDCEDTSVLFTSLLENLNYDTILLFYIIDDTIGHLASGVSGIVVSDGDSLFYEDVPYFYCETTSIGFSAGEKPNDIPDEPEKIIEVK